MMLGIQSLQTTERNMVTQHIWCWYKEASCKQNIMECILLVCYWKVD